MTQKSFEKALAELESIVEKMAGLAEKGKVAPLGKHLKNFEAGVEARDPEGRTLLMLASRRGDTELVFWLLDQGADVEAIDQPRIGHTVLVHATQSLSPDRDKIIRRLVEAGADINRPCGQRRRTPLMHAAEADVYLDRVEGPVFGNSTKTLIALGARMETKDARGNTVWQLIKKDAIGHALRIKKDGLGLGHALRVRRTNEVEPEETMAAAYGNDPVEVYSLLLIIESNRQIELKKFVPLTKIMHNLEN